MKSPLTKIAATAAIIIAVLFLITFFDKAATPAYALEQTIEANHTIKTIYLRIFEGAESIENNEFSDYWIKYNDAGKLSNLRRNEHDKNVVRFTVWNEGIKKTWIPEKNVVFLNRLNSLNSMDKNWEDFAKEFEPKFRLQWLYDQAEEKDALDIEIDEPAEDSNSIYVKATHSVNKVRVELVVDRKTKLIKKLSLYHLREQEYELDIRIEFLAYNQPIDPSMFELRGIPNNAKVYDQVNQLVGLEKGDLTNEEIAAKVVREALEATIAKDYGQVRRLMEGDPGDTIEEFIEKEFEARLVRIVSIGRPEEHEKNNRVLYFVPCEIEVENEERGRWIVNIIATSKAIGYQDDRWIMHTDLRVSEPHILSTSTLNEQDRIEGNIIVPGLRVGDYNLGISKDEVLRKLGEPEAIQLLGEDEVVRRGEERYNLDNLPRRYYMSFGDISFEINDDSVKGIGVHSSFYKFTNGLRVGDSEEKIKQAFGYDFNLKEFDRKDFLNYEDKGLQFEIRKKDRTIMEIGIYRTTEDHGDSDAPDSRKVIMLGEQPPGPITFPKIDRRPKPLGLGGGLGRGEIKSLPKYDPNSTELFQVDLRGGDLSRLDLSDSIDNLMYATFDDDTVWPKSVHVPEEFDTKKIMKLGKNPGLGVRTLHKMGITGKGVGVAIIDQPLLTEHQEYADRLRLYEENNVKESDVKSRMHGAAVASIAVGKTVGVAPDADLYYIATWDLTWDDDPLDNFVFRAQSIRRLLEINRQLPANRKIRVISNSIGWSPSQDGYDEITAACEEAKAAGIFVVSCGRGVYGFNFGGLGGLGRHPLASPNLFETYEPSLYWAKIFYDSTPGRDSDALFVPMDSRTTASPTGIDEYVFYRQGGASWCAPYIAGVYALAVQVEPEITPERFWDLAIKTGRTIELENKGKKIPFGPILDPVKLIDAIKQ